MSDQVTAPTEVQTPAEVAPIEPAPTSTDSQDDVLNQIAEARIGGAPTKEIERLEALLTAPAAPEPVTPAPPAAEATTETIEETTEEEPETPAGEQPPEEKAPRIRVHDPLDQAFLALRKAGKSPEEAHQAVYGKSEPAPAIPEPPPVPPALAAIDTEIATHEATLAEIAENMKAYVDEKDVFADEIRELERKELKATVALTKAIGKRPAVQLAEMQRTAAKQTQTDKTQRELQALAKEYPDIANEKSDLFRETRKQSLYWNSEGDPRGQDPRACTEEAVKLLKINPVKVVSPVVTPVTPKAPGPALGSRTSSPPPVEKPVAEQVDEMEQRAAASVLGEKYVPGRNYMVAVETR